MPQLSRIIVLLCTVLVPSGVLWAAPIVAVSPASQTKDVGDSISVAIQVSGLDGTSSLGVFDVDLAFDPSILSFGGSVYGDPVLGDQLDLFGLGTLATTTAGPGLVNLFELSFDDATDLESLQADAFILATLHFAAVGSGVSPLALTINALGDASGNPLVALPQAGDVAVRAVPEPSVPLLLGSGLLACFASRRRRHCDVH